MLGNNQKRNLVTNRTGNFISSSKKIESTKIERKFKKKLQPQDERYYRAGHKEGGLDGGDLLAEEKHDREKANESQEVNDFVSGMQWKTHVRVR